MELTKADFKTAKMDILNEINAIFSKIDENEVTDFTNLVCQVDKVFFVGVGRVLLSLESTAKRFSHLGINSIVVGQITEPAITEKDLLVVGSNSGESLYPLLIAKKAKTIGAMVAHIGSNSDSSMAKYTDLFLNIPVNSKVSNENYKSIQPMTSLFEQTLYLLGDCVSLMIIRKNSLELDTLWEFHANLE